jgi:hypothetical protein
MDDQKVSPFKLDCRNFDCHPMLVISKEEQTVVWNSSAGRRRHHEWQATVLDHKSRLRLADSVLGR